MNTKELIIYSSIGAILITGTWLLSGAIAQILALISMAYGVSGILYNVLKSGH
jgi:hypothetical protein